MDNLSRRVCRHEIIKPWLKLGPFYQDVSGSVRGIPAFEFNRRDRSSQAGLAEAEAAVVDAALLLASRPYESERATYRQFEGRWHLVRQPSEVLWWGHYFYANHLTTGFFSTRLYTQEPGPKQWRLLRGLANCPCRVIVAVNGSVVYDSDSAPKSTDAEAWESRFEASLQTGENIVNVGTFRVSKSGRAGFRLEIEDGEVEAKVALSDRVAIAERERIEREVLAARVVRDLVYPDHEISVRFVTPVAGPLRVRLLSRDPTNTADVTPPVSCTWYLQSPCGPPETIREVTVAGGREFSLGKAEPLRDGPYEIECTWLDAEGEPVTEIHFAIQKVTPAPNVTGYERLDERKTTALALAERARRPIGSNPRPLIWTQVARYALGRPGELDERILREACRFIDERRDCADFILAGLLRLMHLDRKEGSLSWQVRSLARDAILGFAYWTDEPGDTAMNWHSENHEFRFHVNEWLAGLLYPHEEFRNSRQRGLFHVLKGRTYMTEWMVRKGKFGFDEWHSVFYLSTNIPSLANVHDFAPLGDEKLRDLARSVLDSLAFIGAADSLDGTMGTPHNRAYGKDLKHPQIEGFSPTNWLLYGTGWLMRDTLDDAVVALASSKYRPPEIMHRMATDRESVVSSRIRQGMGNLRGGELNACYCVHRTPDYMVSALQDFRKGGFDNSIHVGQVTLRNHAVVFWSCPHTCEEGAGLRPDYWSGNDTLPRVVQYRNLMSLHWRRGPHTWMTHCFFDPSRFDEVRTEGKWAFGRVERGYVGVYSHGGYLIGDYGQYAGRELVCAARENVWLAECGREADSGSFADFADALLSAAVSFDGESFAFDSPSVGRFVTGWDAKPTIDGEEIPLRDYPLVESPWAFSAFGSGRIVLSHGEDSYEIWTNL